MTCWVTEQVALAYWYHHALPYKPTSNKFSLVEVARKTATTHCYHYHATQSSYAMVTSMDQLTICVKHVHIISIIITFSAFIRVSSSGEEARGKLSPGPHPKTKEKAVMGGRDNANPPSQFLPLRIAMQNTLVTALPRSSHLGQAKSINYNESRQRDSRGQQITGKSWKQMNINGFVV